MASKKTFIIRFHEVEIMGNFQKNNYSLLLIFLLISYLLTGCFNDKKIKCREITTIAVQLDNETKSNLTNQNPKNVLAVADAFDNSAKRIKTIKIKDQQLNKYNEELGNIYQEYAEATRNFIKAFQDKDLDEALNQKEKVTNLFQQQQQVVNNINNYCQ